MNESSNARDIIGQYHTGKPVIGCFPLYPPVELFTSLELFPVVLWNLKSSIGDLALADRHVQSYACATARELVQFVISEAGRLLDGIYSYNACDTLRNTPEILSQACKEADRQIPMLRMHIPQVNRQFSNPEDYLKNDIRLLIKETEAAFGVSFSPSAFRKSTEQYALLRKHYNEADELVSKGKIPFNAFCETVLSNYFRDIKDQIKTVEELLKIAQHKRDSFGKPVMISGIMPPPSEIIHAIESAGMTVVANDIASMKRSYDCDPGISDDPVTYYNSYFSEHFPCTTLLYQADHRMERFLRLVDESGAKGVVFSGEKFCEHEYFEFPILEKKLKEMGVATLFLEFGIDDYNNLDAYKTRVGAFSEILQE